VTNFIILVFSSSKANISLSLYIKGAIIMFLLIYVDDIIVVSSSSAAIDALLWDLHVDFALKDLRHLHYFLGIQVSRTIDGLSLSQEQDTAGLLHRVDMQHCKPAMTPLSSMVKLSMQGGRGTTQLQRRH
jgi:hypothetical protein